MASNRWPRPASSSLLPLLLLLALLLLPAASAAARGVTCHEADADAVAALAARPELARYYAAFRGRRLGHSAAVAAVAAEDDEGAAWLSALAALHAAFPDKVKFTAGSAAASECEGGGVVAAGDGADVRGMPEAREAADAIAAAAVHGTARRPDVEEGGRNATSRCNATATEVVCERLEGTVFIGLAERSFLWQTPLGTAPPGGWPVVVHYHGSFGAPHVFSWNARLPYPFGLYWQGLTIKALLDAGYAVITPESHLNGFLFWDTNLPVWRTYWERSPDHDFVVWLLDEMSRGANGTFGPLDPSRFYAAGLSSGAYMTSRMAVNYNGRFRALAVHSGSYANCAGPICNVPSLPADHPPTLFLHGEQDLIVGIGTMEEYAAQMEAQGLIHRVVVDPVAAHEWIAQAVEEVPLWFDTHR